MKTSKSMFGPRRLLLGPICLLLLVSLAGCCFAGSSPQPKIEWDTSPDALIIEATHEKGGESGSVHGTLRSAASYIPEGRVWGDGHILWVERTGRQRRVMEGRLSRDEMTRLLQAFVNGGFFGWSSLYMLPLPFSSPPRDDSLTVRLRSQSKTVRVTSGNPPEAFDALLRRVTSGSGAPSSVFKPSSGYLKAYPFPSGREVSSWPKDRFGFSLQEVGADRYIDGEALELVWQILNNDFVYPQAIESEGTTLRVELLVSGVTLMPPP